MVAYFEKRALPYYEVVHDLVPARLTRAGFVFKEMISSTFLFGYSSLLHLMTFYALNFALPFILALIHNYLFEHRLSQGVKWLQIK